jgi:hypothetical protein
MDNFEQQKLKANKQVHTHATERVEKWLKDIKNQNVTVEFQKSNLTKTPIYLSNGN